MRYLRRRRQVLSSFRIRILRVFTHVACSDLSEYVKRFLEDENFGPQEFFELSEEMSFSVRKFEKLHSSAV